VEKKIDDNGKAKVLSSDDLLAAYRLEKKGCEPPSPEGGEEKNEFVSRCIKKLADEKGDEYDNDQRVAICYSIWREKSESSSYLRYDCKNCGYSYLVEHSKKPARIELCPRCFNAMKVSEQFGATAGDYIVPPSNIIDNQSYIVVRLDDIRLPLDETMEERGFDFLGDKGISVISSDGKTSALKFNKSFGWDTQKAKRFVSEKWRYLKPEINDNLAYAPKILRRLLNNRIDLIREWRRFYIEAFKENAISPSEVAWKKFNEAYEKNNGIWEAKKSK